MGLDLGKKPLEVIIVCIPQLGVSLQAMGKAKSIFVRQVGGSITGLMHGIILKRLGHNVRILERKLPDQLEGQGAGITALEKVVEFLSTHDFSKQANFVPSAQIQFFDRAANMRKVWKVPLSMTSWNTLYYRLRANFDGLTSEYVPQTEHLKGDGDGMAVYESGISVNGVQDEGDIATVPFEYADGKIGTRQADLVIAADGPSSSIRTLLQPELQRKYVGYVAWRGTVLESEVSESTKKAFNQNITYYVHRGATILMYTIPGKNGNIEPSKRLLNYVWYCNYTEGSPEFEEIMTDSDGHHHRYTVPLGKVRASLWSAQKAFAKKIMPPPLAEIIEKTKQPLIQTIADVEPAKPVHYSGKLLVVGDALCPFRPHVGSSTNQAALNALLLEKAMKGEITMEEWEQQCLDYAQVTSLTSIAWGNRNQFGLLIFLRSAFWVIVTRLRLILRNTWSGLPTFGL